jgi:WD40 repeat protein
VSNQTHLIKKRWVARAESARGASHALGDIVNQDAGLVEEVGDGSGCVMAVADGHGDPLHARSDKGSKFAVEIAVRILADWIKRYGDAGEADVRRAAAGLPEAILTAWRRRVADALKADPPHREEAERLRAGASAGTQDGALLYGSTLLAAAICMRFVVYLQIGDGDIVAVTGEQTPRRPVTGRSDLPISQTDSLCQPDALTRFKLKVDFFTTDHARPDMIMMATDGYANSFDNDSEFLVVGHDFKKYLEDSGIDWVFSHAHAWLSETSERGSGDDITLALAWFGSPRRKKPPRPWPMPGRAALAAVLLLVALAGGWEGWRWLRPLPPSPTVAQGTTVIAKASIAAIAFSPAPDGGLAAATAQGLELWDLKLKPLPSPAGSPAPATALAYSADGKLIAVGSDSTIVVLPVSSAAAAAAPQKAPPKLPLQPGLITSLAISPDGATIVYAAGDQIFIWVPVKNSLRYLESGRVILVALRADGKLLTVGDAGVVLWNLDDGTSSQVLPAEPGVAVAAVSHDGATLAIAGPDRQVRLFNLATATAQPVKTFECQAAPVALAFSPDGALIACASQSGLTVYQLAQGVTRNLASHAGAPNSVAFSPDGAHVAAGTAGKAIEFWNVPKFKTKK